MFDTIGIFLKIVIIAAISITSIFGTSIIFAAIMDNQFQKDISSALDNALRR